MQTDSTIHISEYGLTQGYGEMKTNSGLGVWAPYDGGFSASNNTAPLVGSTNNSNYASYTSSGGGYKRSNNIVKFFNLYTDSCNITANIKYNSNDSAILGLQILNMVASTSSTGIFVINMGRTGVLLLVRPGSPFTYFLGVVGRGEVARVSSSKYSGTKWSSASSGVQIRYTLSNEVITVYEDSKVLFQYNVRDSRLWCIASDPATAPLQACNGIFIATGYVIPKNALTVQFWGLPTNIYPNAYNTRNMFSIEEDTFYNFKNGAWSAVGNLASDPRVIRNAFYIDTSTNPMRLVYLNGNGVTTVIRS